MAKTKKSFQYKKSTLGIVVGAFLLFTAIIIIIVSQISNTPNERVAVFLSNGEVYFGNIADENNEKLTLENIYYLRSSEKIQGSNVSTENKISVIKLGSEVHGPESKMVINKTNLLYYEKMKPDSKINQVIEKK